MLPNTTSPNLPRRIFLIRHGETAWTLSRQHTGLKDIPLTPQGEKQAALLGKRLQKERFTHIFSSPLQRALRTCHLCDLRPILDPDLVEWDYGAYEGLTSKEIAQKEPNWNLFTHPVPGGESLEEIGRRADRCLSKLKCLSGDIALFSSGHILRVLTARFLDLPPQEGMHWVLSTASLSILSYEHGNPALFLWNDIHHLNASHS